MAQEPLFSEWRTYEKVVAHDYMHHAVYFDDLVFDLRARMPGPVSVLDLGCGDARPAIRMLDRVAVARYVGIDESKEALRCAALALEGCDFPVTLHASDMMKGIDEVDGQFDVVIASYSLHHLSKQEKHAMLAKCHSRLNSGGVFAVIDVFLLPDETRDAYIARWHENARARFTALAAAELDTLLDHVATRDLPESVATYQSLALDAGYSNARVLRAGPEQLNQLVLLS